MARDLLEQLNALDRRVLGDRAVRKPRRPVPVWRRRLQVPLLVVFSAFIGWMYAFFDKAPVWGIVYGAGFFLTQLALLLAAGQRLWR